MIQFQGEIRKKVLFQLLLLLCHPFPVVSPGGEAGSGLRGRSLERRWVLSSGGRVWRGAPLNRESGVWRDGWCQKRWAGPGFGRSDWRVTGEVGGIRGEMDGVRGEGVGPDQRGRGVIASCD